jgi:DNA-binding response OmpR family regulator
MKILLAEANRSLARALKRGLEEQGFVVSLSENLSFAMHLAASEKHDLIVLDVPPRIELAVLRHWRRCGITTPVLFLSVPGGRADQFDDLRPATMVTKPFDFDDLLTQLWQLGEARLEAETGAGLATGRGPSL